MKSREEYLECFRVECYDEANKVFQNKTLQNFARNREHYIQQLQDAIKKFMEQIGKMQIIECIPVGCIEISFLRISAGEKNLNIVLEAYDMDQELGNCFANAQIGLDWLSGEWEEIKQNLEERRNQDKWAGNIRKADILNMLQDSLYDLFVGMTFFYKYELQECREWKEYQEMVRTKYFYISMGEYHDWQKKLFVDRENFDIFQIEPDISLRYGVHDELIYHKKEFRKMDLKGSKFVKVIFRECQFYNVQMMDNQFRECQFIKCKFGRINFSGSVFEDCIFEKCDALEIIWFDNVTTPADMFDDLYRKTVLHKCHFKKCDINKEQIDKCILINTDMMND